MTKTYDILIERDPEGYYVASVPALPGCHTQAKSLDKLMVRIREAVELCRKQYRDEEASEFVGIQRLALKV